MQKEGIFSAFLRELAPFVVVCGSFVRCEEKMGSNIGCFLRSRPVEEVDPEATQNNETYMPEVTGLIQRYGFFLDSVCVGHIAVERQCNVPRMVEVFEHYRIRRTEPVFIREIYRIPMMCALDDRYAPREECYDRPEWSEKDCGMVIRFPLPGYRETAGQSKQK